MEFWEKLKNKQGKSITMPTGFGYEVINGKVNSPEEFVRTCARAFGAFADKRDDPSGPVTDDDLALHEVESSDERYYRERLNSAESELSDLENMSDPAKISMVEAKISHRLKEVESEIKIIRKANKKFEEIVETLTKWNPPEDYRRLKEFCIEQANMSFQDDSYYVNERKLLLSAKKNPMGYFRKKILADVNHDIKYNKEQLAKEKNKKSKNKITDWKIGFKSELDKIKELQKL